MSDWYTPSGWPATNAPGASAPARAEFVLVQQAMAKLPAITGATVGAAVVINGSGTALTTTTGALALAGNLTTTGAFNTTFVQQATATFTLPAATDTLVGRASTDTLTNKTISGSSNTLSNIGNSSLTNSSITIGSTAVSLGGTAATIAGLTLTSPTISTITNAGTLTLPTSTDTLVGRATTDALTNKTVNGLSVTTTTGTLTISNGKTLTVTNNATVNQDLSTTAVPTFAGIGSALSGAQALNNSFYNAMSIGTAGVANNQSYHVIAWVQGSSITASADVVFSGGVANLSNYSNSGGGLTMNNNGGSNSLLINYTGNGTAQFTIERFA